LRPEHRNTPLPEQARRKRDAVIALAFGWSDAPSIAEV
jgi:hypothetical protein